MKRILAEGLVIGMSAALLWHFSNIWRYGQHLINEPSLPIRTLETAMLGAILIFGIYRFVNSLRGKD